MFVYVRNQYHIQNGHEKIDIFEYELGSFVTIKMMEVQGSCLISFGV